jgi:hypothetical protein
LHTLAAFCSRSPDSPTQMLSTSLDTRISRMGLLAFDSFCFYCRHNGRHFSTNAGVLQAEQGKPCPPNAVLAAHPPPKTLRTTMATPAAKNIINEPDKSAVARLERGRV